MFLPGDDRLNDAPARHPQNVAGHSSELQVGVFKNLRHAELG
jgi:hypothetical protein